MKLTVREMVLVSMFAALACAGGLLLRFGGTAVVPFSILPFIVMLAGVLLGGRLAALSMIVYVAMGFIGLPVFGSAPFGGPAYFVKPSAGFLFGFIAMAYVIGKILENKKKKVSSCFIASCLGLVALYLIGLPYLYVVLNYYVGKAVSVTAVLKIGFLPFIGFDIIKALLVSIIAVPVARQVGARRKAL
jgi:biotin transport system substrate-specific component